MRPQQDFSSEPLIVAAIQRGTPRTFVRMPAWVSLDKEAPTEHVAFVRDISPKGLFLYSDFRPDAGEDIRFLLEYLKGPNRVRLHLSGKVVRLEQAAGAAVGIAVRFDSPQDNVPRSRLRIV